MNIDLLNKYNVPVPRYTSYPTVPFWNDKIEASDWTAAFKKQFDESDHTQGISLYIHLPFCESLCTYCGCNKKITTNHNVELPYLEALFTEWRLYLQLMNEKPVIREIHLGGGTPTFFSSDNLYKLLATILKDSIVPEDHDFSIEGHPNNTTAGQLLTLYNLGFRRISFGVQDNNPEVQRVINRIQSFEQVKRGTEIARHIGYTSVNFDLIYGLPLQNTERMRKTLYQSISLKPDRIAFYSYAHVPWTNKAQRLFDEADLPLPREKMKLYMLGKEMFAEAGYKDIGMDHFALPGYDLFKAKLQNRLYRNFMGYTTQNTKLLLGLGLSSISDVGYAFMQNSKTLGEYYQMLGKGQLPIQKGYFLTEEDRAFRKYIQDISCHGSTFFDAQHLPLLAKYTFPELQALEDDGLVLFDNMGLAVTGLGKNFIRNICRAFDLHLLRTQNEMGPQQFSNAI